MGVTTVVKDYGTAVLNAIRDNDLKTFKAICEKHLKTDRKIAALCITDIKHKPTKKFACPLILAARQEDPTIIKYMMDRNVDPNFVHHTVYTSRRKEIVTALHIAVDLSLFQTVEILLNANADANIGDHNEETALHIAVKRADWVMARMLLSKGADPSIADRRGNAPLHIATLYGHLQLVKTLLKHDADVYQKGQFGSIPSHIAAKEGHIHLVQVFCSRDVGNINIQIPCYADQREKAPLHLAAENGHAETVVALLDQFNAEVNLKDSDGNTPLHCCVLNPYHPYKMRDKDYFYATAKVLIRYHVSINEKNKYGETALHLAAANHYQKIVELLLSVGANAFAENDQRLKPIDVVPESDTVTKQLLKSAMLQPRPALNVSMLSMQNMSLPGLQIGGNNHRGRGNSTGPAFPTNGIIPPSFVRNRNDMSFRSSSSISSVFVNDIKMGRGQNGGQPLHTVDEDHNGNEQENEIPLYSHINKRDRKKERRGLDGREDSSLRGSKMSLNSLAEREAHKSRSRRQHSLENVENAKNREKMKSSRSRERSESRERSQPISPQESPAKSRHRKKDSSIYENLGTPPQSRSSKSHANREAPDDRKVKKEKRKKHKDQMSINSAEIDSDFYGEEGKVKKEKRKKHKDQMSINSAEIDSDFYGEEGVRVHTIPGRPSTIEVEYSRGPITIEVDTQGSSYDLNQKSADVEEEWEEEDSFEDEEEEEVVQTKSPKKKNKSRDPVYSNHMQIMEEMEKKKKQMRSLEKQKAKEEKEMKRLEEFQRQEEKEVEDEREVRREERRKRRERKEERRKLRQEQFELEQQFEDMPTEEPPPDQHFELELPEEVLNESSFDSDSFEEEQIKSERELKKSAKRRVSEVTESIKMRWSQDEDEDDREVRKKRRDLPVAAKRNSTTKPPRPSNLTQYETGENQSSDPSSQAGQVFEPGLDQDENYEKKGRIVGKSFQTDMIEISHSDVVRMETVVISRAEQKRQVTEQFVPEKDSDDDEELQNLESGSGYPVRKGLNMRVTGEVPKAYTRGDKSSARKAFMLAHPVGIESSSEASDSELGASRTSLNEIISERSAQQHAQWGEPMIPVYTKPQRGKGHNVPVPVFPDSDENSQLIGSYAKPYKSFGKIETKTDALEEAISEAENNSFEQGMSLSTFSANASTDVKAALDSPKSGRKQNKDQKPPSDIVAAMKLPTILNSPTKVSKQFSLTEEDSNQTMEYRAKMLTTVPTIIPEMYQIKATDVASDDDSFDDDSFDDLSEEDNNMDPSTGKKEVASNEIMIIQPRSSVDPKLEEQTIKGKKVIGMPTPLASITQMQDGRKLKKSSDSLKNIDADLEEYNEEPGARRPKNRGGKGEGSHQEQKDLKSNDDEQGAMTKKLKKSVDKKGKSVEKYEEEMVEEIEITRKTKSKKTKNQTNSNAVEGEENEGKKTKKKQKLKVPADVSTNVWEEASLEEPLASSETYESVSKKKKQVPRMKIQTTPDLLENEENSDNEGTEYQPKKSGELLSELNEKLLKKNKFDSDENGLDVEIPLAAPRWREPDGVIFDKSLDISIPTVDEKFADENEETKWQIPRKGRHSEETNLDEFVGLEEETLDDDTMNSTKSETSAGRIIGRRQQRIAKQEGSKSLSKSTDAEEFSKDDDSLPGYQRKVFSSFGIDTWKMEEDSDELPTLNPYEKQQPRVLKPPKPNKPSYLTSNSTQIATTTEKTQPGLPAKQSTLPVSNGGKVEIVEMNKGSPRTALPRYPHRSYTENQSGTFSDTDVTGRHPAGRRRGMAGAIHSEAEASDFEPPKAPGPGRSYKQAAMDSINAGIRRPPNLPSIRLLRQPGHHDKSFDFYKKLFKPKVRRTRVRHLIPTAGRYGDSELHRVMSSRSATESESEMDQDQSYVEDEDPEPGSRPASVNKVVHPVYESLMRQKEKKKERQLLSQRSEAPDNIEPGPVDFQKYDVRARLWMEQVDRKTVQKSNTMYLSVLPSGQDLPREIMESSKYRMGADGSSSTVEPQWVMARSRMLRLKRDAAQRPQGNPNMSGYEGDLTIDTFGNPGKQMILFFKVGSNWLDLAWVLFDGLLKEPEIVRMIKDIELKNKGVLTEQVHDLMHRWWSKKGNEATIEELQRVLDMVHVQYIQEEYSNQRGASFVAYSDTEDDLDVGEVPDSDPNVSRIMKEYDRRSVNASFNIGDKTPALLEELNPEVVLRKLQESKEVPTGMTDLYTRASRNARNESHDSTLDRSMKPDSRSHSANGSPNESAEEEKRTILVVNKKKKKKPFKHETNL